MDAGTPTVNARAYSLLRSIMNTAVIDEEIEGDPCRIPAAGVSETVHKSRPATVVWRCQ